MYVATEGAPGIAARVGAWKHAHEYYERAGVLFATQPVLLLEGASVASFVNAIDRLEEKPRLVVLDTLARCLTGSDENSSRDMGLAVDAIDRIRQLTGATVLAVHHTRKDGEVERGSTALRGALDTMIALKRDENRITVTCEKQKDAAPFAPFSVELVPTAESCTLVTAEHAIAVRSRELSSRQREALEVLQRGSLEDGLSLSQWLKASGIPERTFYQCRTELVANSYVDRIGGRGGRYIVTPAGGSALTANCNATATRTA